METSRQHEAEKVTGRPDRASALPVRHALRDQEALWDEFLAMGLAVVDSLSKSVAVLCEGRFEVVPEVKSLEKDSDRAEVRIEQECLRVLALFEPVASDLRRLATILKVSRDWERIADLAARIARRARKLSKKPNSVPVPDPLKSLAGDVLAQVCASYDALSRRDATRAGGGRRRSSDRSPIPSASSRIEGIPPSAPRTVRRLAPVDEHGAEPRTSRRPRHRNRPDDRLLARRGHHPP